MWRVCLCLPKPYSALYSIFPSEKAKIWEIKEKAKKPKRLKYVLKQNKLVWSVKNKSVKTRSQRAAEARREELAKTKGEDPVKAALERLKAKQAGSAANKETKTIVSEKGKSYRITMNSWSNVKPAVLLDNKHKQI